MTERRRRPVSINNGFAERRSIDTGSVNSPGKGYFGNRMNRAEVVPKRDAIWFDNAGVDANIVEPSQTEQVGDAFAHGGHRERLANAGFEHPDERGVGRFTAL